MTWSYDTTLPVAKDRVRFAIGDTDEAEQLFSDEEVAAILTQEGDEDLAALQLVQALIARFARRADVAVGGMRENLSQLVKQYMLLADRLRQSIDENNYASNLSVHGVSVMDATAVNLLADRMPSQFETAAFDNPKASVEDEGRNDRF